MIGPTGAVDQQLSWLQLPDDDHAVARLTYRGTLRALRRNPSQCVLGVLVIGARSGGRCCP